MRVIAGDIGGTKTRIGLFEVAGSRLEEVVEVIYASAEFRALDDIVAAFVDQVGCRCQWAAFALAGPVRGQRARTTNLPWLVDAGEMEKRLGFERVVLLNDLEAVAYGIGELVEEDFLVLNPGAADASGNAAIIAAGTGLGMAGLYWDGSRYHPFPSEGGHADFAPNGEQQVGLLRFLARQWGHVSVERVLSGPGLVNIFRFLLQATGSQEPPWLAEALTSGDPAAAIAEAALTRSSLLAVEALDLFVAIYGAHAGNLALTVMATGGVYLGGGIAPKIATKLQESAFLQAFVGKGRMRPLLEAMPVKAILNPRVGLVGAARFAQRKLAGEA